MLKSLLLLILVCFACGVRADNSYPPGTLMGFITSFGATYTEEDVEAAERLRRRGWEVRMLDRYETERHERQWEHEMLRQEVRRQGR